MSTLVYENHVTPMMRFCLTTVDGCAITSPALRDEARNGSFECHAGVSNRGATFIPPHARLVPVIRGLSRRSGGDQRFSASYCP
jgi:hypothetical protein